MGSRKRAPDRKPGWLRPLVASMLFDALSDPRRIPRNKRFFERAMVLRAVRKWGYSEQSAADTLSGWERDIGAAYGDPAYDWSVAGAWAIVDDFCEDR